MNKAERAPAWSVLCECVAWCEFSETAARTDRPSERNRDAHILGQTGPCPTLRDSRGRGPLSLERRRPNRARAKRIKGPARVARDHGGREPPGSRREQRGQEEGPKRRLICGQLQDGLLRVVARRIASDRAGERVPSVSLRRSLRVRCPVPHMRAPQRLKSQVPCMLKLYISSAPGRALLAAPRSTCIYACCSPPDQTHCTVLRKSVLATTTYERLFMPIA